MTDESDADFPPVTLENTPKRTWSPVTKLAAICGMGLASSGLVYHGVFQTPDDRKPPAEPGGESRWASAVSRSEDATVKR